MIIEAHGLRKTFTAKRGRGKTEEVEAVRGIDLAVDEGEIFGCLGPNGAGKTTTIRMLATFTAPTSGTARVAGHDVLNEAGRSGRSIGYVSQAGGVDDNAPGRESLLLAARSTGSHDAGARPRRRAAGAVRPDRDGDRPARRSPAARSGGSRSRSAWCTGRRCSSSTSPPPASTRRTAPTSGTRSARCATEGTSVLLTTHYLDEADALCDRLVIIDHGRIVAEGTPGELKHEVAGDVVTLRLDEQGRRRRSFWPRAVHQGDPAEGDALRVYLDDGEHTLPTLLRALEARRPGDPVHRARPGHARRRLPAPNRPLPPRRRLTRPPSPVRPPCSTHHAVSGYELGTRPPQPGLAAVRPLQPILYLCCSLRCWPAAHRETLRRDAPTLAGLHPRRDDDGRPLRLAVHRLRHDHRDPQRRAGTAAASPAWRPAIVLGRALRT